MACQTALHATPLVACGALEEIATLLGQSDLRLDHAIRQRLTTLATHDASVADARRVAATLAALLGVPAPEGAAQPPLAGVGGEPVAR